MYIFNIMNIFQCRKRTNALITFYSYDRNRVCITFAFGRSDDLRSVHGKTEENERTQTIANRNLSDKSPAERNKRRGAQS